MLGDMAIAFMRHGQTDWNLHGKVQGHTDIPLNETGKEQAHDAGKALQAEGKTWTVITSSPLSRATETGTIVASYLDLQLSEPLPGLIEQSYGVAEGIKVTEMRTRWPNRDFPGGEPPEQLANRALATLELLDEAYPGEEVLAISHGAYIRRLIALITGHEYYQVPGIENATLTLFDRDTNGAWQVHRINNEDAARVLSPAPEASGLVSFPGTDLSGTAAGVCTTEGVCEV